MYTIRPSERWFRLVASWKAADSKADDIGEPKMTAVNAVMMFMASIWSKLFPKLAILASQLGQCVPPSRYIYTPLRVAHVECYECQKQKLNTRAMCDGASGPPVDWLVAALFPLLRAVWVSGHLQRMTTTSTHRVRAPLSGRYYVRLWCGFITSFHIWFMRFYWAMCSSVVTSHTVHHQ